MLHLASIFLFFLIAVVEHNISPQKFDRDIVPSIFLFFLILVGVVEVMMFNSPQFKFSVVVASITNVKYVEYFSGQKNHNYFGVATMFRSGLT